MSIGYLRGMEIPHIRNMTAAGLMERDGKSRKLKSVYVCMLIQAVASVNGTKGDLN